MWCVCGGEGEEGDGGQGRAEEVERIRGRRRRPNFTAVHLAKNRLREVGSGFRRGLLEQTAGVLLVEKLEVVEA